VNAAEAAGRGFQIVVCGGNERMPESSPGSVWDRRVGHLAMTVTCADARRELPLAHGRDGRAIFSRPQAKVISRQVRLPKLATA